MDFLIDLDRIVVDFVYVIKISEKCFFIFDSNKWIGVQKKKITVAREDVHVCVY